MKDIKINNEEELNQYIRRNILFIKEEINKNNKVISGSTFEIFGYSDFEDVLEEEKDYNFVLYSFMINQMGFNNDNFLLLSSESKIYNFVGFMFQRRCLRFLKDNNGGLEIKKNNFDYKIKFWISKLTKSNIKGEKKYMKRIEVNFIIKIIVLKYN